MGASGGDRLCIENQRYDEAVFTTEDEECRQLLTLLSSGRMARYRTDHPVPNEPPEMRGPT